jgi:predicted lipase
MNYSNLNNDILTEITKLSLLCNISYFVKDSQTYTPTSTDETKLFQTVSADIKNITTSVDYINAITTLSLDGTKLYIAIPGTQGIKDTLDDLQVCQVNSNFSDVPDEQQITFHSGFYEQYQYLLPGITKEVNNFLRSTEYPLINNKQIIITGHSLGGATASIYGCYLKMVHNLDNINVVTFGAPLFTNSIGADWFENNLNFTRVEVYGDPVVNVPVLYNLGFQHVKKNHIYISNFGINLNKSPNYNKPSKMVLFRIYMNYLFCKNMNTKYHHIMNYIVLVKKYSHF